MSAKLLEEQYLEKATKAYRDQNLKLCLIYFRKITTLWNVSLINLLVDSAYRLWKSNIEQQDSSGIRSNEDNELSELIQNAFSQLLSGIVPFHLISSFDYIRLTHIYIVEGNLLGALEICNLASNRGLLEDVLIVTQTWTIIKRIEGMKQREINDRINFLISAVPLLAAENTKNNKLDNVIYIGNSQLPLSYVFLFCCNHLSLLMKQRPKTIKQQDQRQAQYKVMLVEAFFLHTGIKEYNIDELNTWFQDPQLWYEMGKSLENTPFFLLGEDCYWESFVRHPLSNLAIEEQVNSMIKYKRRDRIPFLLREAMMVNPWNTFCRNQLISYEIELQRDSKQREWFQLFEQERKELMKIQACYRGYLLRKHWPEKSLYYYELRSHFLEKMKLSYSYYEYALTRYQLSLLKQWKVYIETWKSLKRKSSILIQKHHRRHYKQRMYAYLRERVQLTNSKYLLMIYIQLQWRKRSILHHWFLLYNERRKKEAIKTITDVLFLNGYNQLLVKGMNLITTLLRMHRKHSKLAVLKYWHSRYRLRRKKHAFYTIRFFIRFHLRRKIEMKLDEQLKEVELVITQKMEKSFQRNSKSIIKPFWRIWRKIFFERIRLKRLQAATLVLQQQYRLKKAKKHFFHLCIRKETREAWIQHHHHRILSSILSIWRYNAAAYKIIRFFHSSLARWKYKRLCKIGQVIKERNYLKRLKLFEKYWKKYEKYLYLFSREKIRASRIIQRAYRFHCFKNKLKQNLRRKYFYFTLVWKFHYLFTKRCFFSFKYCTKYKCQIQSIHRLNQIFSKYLLRISFFQWNYHSSQQQFLQEIANVLIKKKLTKNSWKNAYQSVRIIKEITFTTNPTEIKEKYEKDKRDDQEATMKGLLRSSSSFEPLVASVSSIDIFQVELAPWERYLKKEKKLLSLSSLSLLKCFSVWMKEYRSKTRSTRLHSLLYSYELYDTVVSRLLKRKEFVISLQCFYRQWKARKRRDSLICLFLKEEELKEKSLKLLQKRGFLSVKAVWKVRKNSRVILQCYFRRLLSKHYYQQTAERFQELKEKENFINSSYFFRKTLMKRMFQQIISSFISSFIKNISNEKYIIHKDHLKKSYRLQQKRKLLFKRKQQKKKKEKSKQLVGKKRNPSNIRENSSIETIESSDDDDGEDEDYDEEYGYQYGNSNGEDGEEETTEEFGDDDKDSALSRLEMIENYHKKLQQRTIVNSSSVPTLQKDISAIPATTTTTAFPSPYSNTSGHIGVVKSLKEQNTLANAGKKGTKKEQQKENIAEIKRRKLLVDTKYAPQTTFYFQSTLFHQCYYRWKDSRAFIFEESYLLSFYPQEIYYLLQQSNCCILLILNKKSLSYLCESFNGKKLVFLNSRFTEKLLERYFYDLLSIQRNFYERIPFETTRWPLTLPFQIADDDDNRDSKGDHTPKKKERKIKTLILEFQNMKMSIYVIMKLCRFLVKQDMSNMNETQSLFLTETAGVGSQPSLIRYYAATENQLYRKAIYSGIEHLITDITSFGSLGFLLLMHSLQVRMVSCRCFVC
jgi:hypothetical protein